MKESFLNHLLCYKFQEAEEETSWTVLLEQMVYVLNCRVYLTRRSSCGGEEWKKTDIWSGSAEPEVYLHKPTNGSLQRGDALTGLETTFCLM